MAGDAASRLPAVRCYGGTVAYGYVDEYDHGRPIAPPPPIFRSGKVNEYVYDEPDNDDYKVFPPPGPGTVIESTGHGYTIVPMKCDKGDDDALLPVFDDLFAMAAVKQGATKVGSAAARPPPAHIYEDGEDAASPSVRPYCGMVNQYEYDEPDNDDYKVFPPPGPGTVIESTGHGYTIVPMTCDKGDDGVLPPDFDGLFSTIPGLAAAMAAVKQGASKVGSGAARPPPVCSYDDGKDAASPPVRPYCGMVNEYVYDEPDNDDYKVFPPPGPGTVIESTGHGYTIVPMKCDKGGDDDALLPVFDGLFAMAAVKQGARKVGSAAARPPPVHIYEDGKAAAFPSVRPYCGMVNQYEYDEPDNDDYKVFPPPAPGTVIDPACPHGCPYTIVPMPAATCGVVTMRRP